MVYKNIRVILIILVLSVWTAVFSVDDNLHIIACDVGQGDSILIQRGNNQILIDGGPDKSVLDCLGRHMPFFDNKIEMVILTHPQADHYGGLIDVFKQYKVGLFGEYNTISSNKGYEVLKNTVGGLGIPASHIAKGTEIHVGLIHLDILQPDDGINSKNVNDDGVVSLLKYGNFEALFTADVENEISDQLSKMPQIKNLEYIKVNHHGSRNGLSENLLKAVMPKYAVISSAKKNSYGHPHKEILDLLNKYNVSILRTDQLGDIEVVTDGYKILD